MCDSKAADMWKKIITRTDIDDQCETKIKDFFVNICLNNLKYMKENFYLITDCNTKRQCIILACLFCNDINVITFLTDVFELDINITNCTGNTYLHMACYENTNLEVIKYLVEHQHMNIKHKNINNKNCLTIACQNNTNVNIAKYLVECTNVSISLDGVSECQWKKVIQSISRNYPRFNNFLVHG